MQTALQAYLARDKQIFCFAHHRQCWSSRRHRYSNAWFISNQGRDLNNRSPPDPKPEPPEQDAQYDTKSKKIQEIFPRPARDTQEVLFASRIGHIGWKISRWKRLNLHYYFRRSLCKLTSLVSFSFIFSRDYSITSYSIML